MIKSINILILPILAVILLPMFAVDAAAHPYEEFSVSGPVAPDGQRFNILSGLDQGSMIFDDPVPAGSLSEVERYMLFGCKPDTSDHSLAANLAIRPWNHYIYTIVRLYYEKTGVMPDGLSAEIVAAAYGKELSELESEYLEFARSPITGAFPTFNNADYSRGNMHLRLITQPEKVYLSSNVDKYQDEWIYLRTYDPRTRKYRKISRLTPIFYCRTYGETGPLFGEIFYGKQVTDF